MRSSNWMEDGLSSRIPRICDYRAGFAARGSSIVKGKRPISSGSDSEPLVTVFTVVRNAEGTLAQTIQSVAGQTYRNIEYVVVDGASTDGTLEVLRRFDAHITRWISEPDHGTSDGTNKALALAQGDILFWLAADDWIEPHVIAAAVERLGSQDLEFVFGDMYVSDGEGNDLFIKGDHDYIPALLSGNPKFNFPALVVKRSCFDKTGLINMTFVVCNDYEWLLRAHFQGARGCYDSRIVVHKGAGGVSDQYPVRSVFERIRILRQFNLPVAVPACRALFEFGWNSARRFVRRVLLSIAPDYCRRLLSGYRVSAMPDVLPALNETVSPVSMRVLKTHEQIMMARRELDRRGLSFIESRVRSFLRRVGFTNGVAIGDVVKSWDVLATVELIEKHVQADAAVLDIGCYASEILLSLDALGYTNLTGIDLNPELRRMPFEGRIRYVNGDFMRTEFPDASFRAITAISVIEHGFDGNNLLREMSRLLVPGGLFIASFDYWPDKIDTTGVEFFGMDWRIFSRGEVARFVDDAARYGFRRTGEMQDESGDRAIIHAGWEYTFAWLVMEKVAPA
jgi:glycosyltransferase involved in cell wall biosynthesis/SAM-dependent methyltransferase